jgi:hypothetical protein
MKWMKRPLDSNRPKLEAEKQGPLLGEESIEAQRQPTAELTQEDRSFRARFGFTITPREIDHNKRAGRR